MRSLRMFLEVLALAGVITVLAACSKSETPAPSTTSPAPSAAADSSPLPGIDPRASDTAGSGVPGPGAGATAVGGMAGQQDAGGAKASSGTPPAPTGGDGAASSPR